MSQNTQLPIPSSKPKAVDLAQLACTWKAVPIASALVEVGVPKLIPVDGSAVGVVQLSQEAKVDADLLYRYMRFLSALGIFVELPDKFSFAHNESSKLLLPKSITFCHLFFFGSAKGGMLAASAEYATHLRDPSKPAIEHAFKMPIWQYVARLLNWGKSFPTI